MNRLLVQTSNRANEGRRIIVSINRAKLELDQLLPEIRGCIGQRIWDYYLKNQETGFRPLVSAVQTGNFRGRYDLLLNRIKLREKDSFLVQQVRALIMRDPEYGYSAMLYKADRILAFVLEQVFKPSELERLNQGKCKIFELIAQEAFKVRVTMAVDELSV